MIRFILNNQEVKTETNVGSTLLDYIRYEQHLVGTKIGCREGDCGACTVVVGEQQAHQVSYQSVTSCITPLGNVHGKHVVTIEGIRVDGLTPYQQAMIDTSGTQCGMCTPGFIMSLAAASLSPKALGIDEIVSHVDGNICRCTGYKSIERAIKKIADQLINKSVEHPTSWLIQNNFIPAYFDTIASRLGAIPSASTVLGDVVVAGGTDLMVQQQDEIFDSQVSLVNLNTQNKGITRQDQTITIKGCTTTTDLLESDILLSCFPKLYEHLKLVSSTPIRNIATLAGNLVNASPIGDLTAFFIALNSRIELKDRKENVRTFPLKEFYKDYKQIDLHADELVDSISFYQPDSTTYFNFEKVSKRRCLDIATVNTGLCLRYKDNIIQEIHISAGGVGPTPKYLTDTCAFLLNKTITPTHIKQALSIVDKEISPISDVRGSEAYKRLLLRQLILSHFNELFPGRIDSLLIS